MDIEFQGNSFIFFWNMIFFYCLLTCFWCQLQLLNFLCMIYLFPSSDCFVLLFVTSIQEFHYDVPWCVFLVFILFGVYWSFGYIGLYFLLIYQNLNIMSSNNLPSSRLPVTCIWLDDFPVCQDCLYPSGISPCRPCFSLYSFCCPVFNFTDLFFSMCFYAYLLVHFRCCIFQF